MMKAKINDRILSIPPHISTSWDHVHSLYTQHSPEGSYTLSIHLDQGQIIHMELDPALIDLAFASHLRYLENKIQQKHGASHPLALLAQLFHLSSDMKESLFTPPPFLMTPESLEIALHHDPKRSADPIDPEMLQRISQVIRWILNDDLSSLSKAEEGCHCPHCQLMRYIDPNPVEEEICSEADLQFKEWDIQSVGEQLYQVANPLNPSERYQVHLGNPLGCTCGETGCPHLLSVLKSYT